MNEIFEVPLAWADVTADPTLRNLPYEIELRDGKIARSPAGRCTPSCKPYSSAS